MTKHALGLCSEIFWAKLGETDFASDCIPEPALAQLALLSGDARWDESDFDKRGAVLSPKLADMVRAQNFFKL